MWDKPRQLNLVAALLATLAFALFAIALVAWLARQPVFAIKRVQFSGDIVEVNPAHLEAVVREALRGTFFTLNLNESQRAFSGVPWVRSASLRRQWPDRLEVTIVEHRALARWNETDLVDTEGEVFRADYDDELPAFTGPEGSAPEVAAQYRRFSAALETLHLAPRELHLSSRRAWKLTLDNGLLIELGREDAARQAADGARIIGHESRQPLRRVEAVDLRYRNGFAVRMPGLAQELRDAAQRSKTNRTEGRTR
jgi:cell division protein FtsQ